MALGVGRLSHEGQHGQRVLWHTHVRPLRVVVLPNHTPTCSSFLGALEKTRQLITGLHTKHMGLFNSHFGVIAWCWQSLMKQTGTLLVRVNSMSQSGQALMACGLVKHQSYQMLLSRYF